MFSRIVGLARLDSGEIAVVSQGTQDVRVFDRQGAFVRSFGRSGRGPGEYLDPRLVGRYGDTLLIFDSPQRRLTYLDARSGTAPSLIAPASERTSVYPIAGLRSRKLLAVPIPWTSMRRPEGLVRYTIEVHLVAPERDWNITTLGTFPWLSSLAVNPTGAERALAVGTYPFGPHLSLTAVGDAVILADGAEPRLQYFDSEGRRTGSVQLPITQRPFDTDVIRRLGIRAVEEARTEPARISLRARHETRFLPKDRPFIRNITAGPHGEVWVELFREDRAAPTEFLIVSASRTPIGRLKVPPSTRVLEVGSDYLLAVQTDDNDEERVVLLRYVR